MNIQNDKGAQVDLRRDRMQLALIAIGFIVYAGIYAVSRNPEAGAIYSLPGIPVILSFALMVFLVLMIAIQRCRYYKTASANAKSANRKLTRAVRQLSEKLNYDPLTGIPNSRLLEDRFNMAVVRAKREKSLFLVCEVVLPAFQSIVTKHGERAGEAIIIMAGKRIERTLRSTDTIVRMDGCKFVLIIESVESPEDISLVARKIRSKLGKSFTVGGKEISAVQEVTMGRFPWDGVTLEALLAADAVKDDRKIAVPGWIDALSDKLADMTPSNLAFLRREVA